MKSIKYILECTGYGVLVAIVVHGMITIGSRLTTGLWLDQGGHYSYAFLASVAMFGALYALFDSMNKKVSTKKWYQYQYARYLLFALFVVFPAIAFGVYKLTYTGPLKMTVIAERQPLYVQLSDGSIQNKYLLKLVNESDQDVQVTFSAKSDMQHQSILGAETPLLMHHGRVNQYTVFIKVPEKNVSREITPIEFTVQNTADPTMQSKYSTVFNGPKVAN